ncbi:MAG: rRNA pseudouridine synthase [Clostridia bacterium]|nr:rRNA pseudouridine synthase [Clostridia bacterium]
MRIDKFLSDCKVATRREAEKAIRRGNVLLDGNIVRRADTPVDPACNTVTYCGETVEYRKYIYVLLNKPDGYVSATEDKNERTVLELLPEEVNKFGVFPCGRLDKNTQGLMLLTNDGDLAHRLLSPRRHVEKVYRFESARPLSAADIDRLTAGVDIGGYVTAPCTVTTDGGTAGVITLCEGKYHQVKLMLNAVDNRVLYLERVRFAFLTPDGLDVGAWRYLRKEEIEKLQEYKV